MLLVGRIECQELVWFAWTVPLISKTPAVVIAIKFNCDTLITILKNKPHTSGMVKKNSCVLNTDSIYSEIELIWNNEKSYRTFILQVTFTDLGIL